MGFKSFKDQKRYGFQVPEMKYHGEYAEDLITHMEKGICSKLELAAKFNVTERCIYIWLENNEDFKNAWDIGYPKAFSWWMSEGKKLYFKNDKGQKFWSSCMRNFFGFDVNESKTVTGNTINIQNNLLTGKETDQQLLEQLKGLLGKLPQVSTNNLPILDLLVEEPKNND